MVSAALEHATNATRFSAPASIVPLLTGLVPVFHERWRPQMVSRQVGVFECVDSRTWSDMPPERR